MIKNYALLLLALWVSGSVFAQDIHPCGTGDYRSEWFDHYHDHKELYRTNSDDTLYLPVQIHVVGTDEGGGYFPPKSVIESFCKLNEDFAHSNIQFYMSDEWNYINNSNYYDHNFQQGSQMMAQNNVSNTINCYIVLSPAGNCGYYSPGRDGIALNKGCLGLYSSTWAHEIGHFLSLPHPFVGWEGEDDVDYDEPAPNFVNGRQVERVDGSNCDDAADRFCDTSPDYLSFRWNCNMNDSSNVLQTDPNGETFRSDGSLIMSYSNDACAKRFSDEQIDAMRANIQFQRPNLIASAFIPQLITSDASLEVIESPAPDEMVSTFDEVTLDWEDVPNASNYLVQVSRIPVFTLLLEEYVVSSSELTLDNLEEDRPYRWRVKPFNAYESCVEFIDSSTFSTGTISNISILEQATALKVFPNPVSQGGAWQISLQLSQADRVGIRLFAIDGRLVFSDEQQLGSGRQEFTVSSQALSDGMYILELNLPKGRLHRKLNVTR